MIRPLRLARGLGWTALTVILALLSSGQTGKGEMEGGRPGCANSMLSNGTVAGSPAQPPAYQQAAAPRSWTPTGGETMAVMDLKAESVSAGDAAVISSLLRGELVKTGRFKTVEKNQMDKVLAEQAFQQTGCTSQDCAVKLGKMLNVQLMVVGEFGKLMGQSYTSARVVNVETGEVVYADKAKGTSADEMEYAIAAMARRVAGLEEAPVQPAPAAAKPAPRGK
jgi:curli biogenesis system outer membrane secretion channel CsgG